jgi:hypothetical protein
MAMRKPAAPDLRLFFDVDIKDARTVHRAIADGALPANVAPIRLAAFQRRDPDVLKEDTMAHGLEIKKRS